MKKKLFLLFLSLNLSLFAETKEVLKRIPEHFDYVLCLRFPKIFKNEKLMTKLEGNKGFEKITEALEKKLSSGERSTLRSLSSGKGEKPAILFLLGNIGIGASTSSATPSETGA